MARAMWKAEVRVGDETCGVKLYAAAESRTIGFHLLHAKDDARVRQRMAHARTGETVAKEDVRRAASIGGDRYVILTDTELESIEPEPSREIRIARFVPPDVIDHRWYERPYLLGPDDGEERRYAALEQALADSGKEGLASWTMRKRDYHGTLTVHAGRLALIALRPTQELVAEEGWEAPEGRDLDRREFDLAKQLVAALSGDFDAAEFRDEYRDRVMELVEAKRDGKVLDMGTFEAAVDDDESLAASLEASLKEAS